jgi:hypothetical protein
VGKPYLVGFCPSPEIPWAIFDHGAVVGNFDRKISGRKIRGIAGVDMILTTNYSNNTNMKIIC